MPITTENDFKAVIEAILADRPGGEASYAEIIAEMPNRITLTADDEAPSPTRTGEPMWHQRVRNITPHKNFGGRLVAIPKGLRLVRAA